MVTFDQVSKAVRHTFVRLTTLTPVRAPKKVTGGINVFVRAERHGRCGTDYAASILRKQAKDGKEPEFNVKSTYCQPIEGISPYFVREHKNDRKRRYLVVFDCESKSREYVDENGNAIAPELLASVLAWEKAENAKKAAYAQQRQGLSDATVALKYQLFSFENIQSLEGIK